MRKQSLMSLAKKLGKHYRDNFTLYNGFNKGEQSAKSCRTEAALENRSRKAKFGNKYKKYSPLFGQVGFVAAGH